MMPAEITTDRLRLRPLAASDEAAVVAALNDIAVSGWLAVVPHPYTAADFAGFLAETARPGETFAVEDAGGLVGVVGLGAHLGYWFVPDAHGKGYATEAARAALSHRFADRDAPVPSGYFEGNVRSARVLEKLGFAVRGRGLKPCRALGQDRPHVEQELTRDAFAAAYPVAARSARLSYRALQPHDLDPLHAIVSQWEVVRQLGSFPWPADRSHTATRARPYAGEGFIWAIQREGRLIGTVGVWEGELGYMLDPSQHRQGFAEEACRTALDRAFGPMGLTEAHAGVWADNAGSLGLLKKLGFGITGETCDISKARGVATPGYVLRLDAAGWPGPSGA